MSLVHLKFDAPTPLLNTWQRAHYHEKRRICQEWAWRIRAALAPDMRPGEPIRRCTITVHRWSSKRADWDGFYGGLKPVLDALVVPTENNPHGQGLIVDDNPDVVVELNGHQHICKPRHGRSELIILEVCEWPDIWHKVKMIKGETECNSTQ